MTCFLRVPSFRDRDPGAASQERGTSYGLTGVPGGPLVGMACGAPDQFQQAKEQLANSVAENVAEIPLGPEEAPKLLS